MESMRCEVSCDLCNKCRKTKDGTLKKHIIPRYDLYGYNPQIYKLRIFVLDEDNE